MIKYIKQDGNIREEFQFTTVDEMIRYFDYNKNNTILQVNEYGMLEEVGTGQQKTLDNNDKNILKEAFDKIGILYQDNGDYLTVKQSDLLDAERIDINFDDTENYKFLNFELMD